MTSLPAKVFFPFVDQPNSLQSITFGNCFNQPIDGVVWPHFLRQLDFGETF